MNATLVMMVMGIDRPGIVERVADIVAAHGGNWEESRMVRLGGRFAGVVSFSLPEHRHAPLRAALLDLREQGLTVFVEDAYTGETGPWSEPLSLELLGSDREGIVKEVTSVLARLSVNVDEMVTHREAAPMGGGMLFRLVARLRCPPNVDATKLRTALENLSSELAVDISLDASSGP